MNFIESGGKPFFEFLRRILTNFALFLRGLTDVVIILFESLSEILTVVAVEVGPWLAPFAPATLTFGHLLNDFGFGEIPAFTVAAAIEVLGLSAGSTLVKTEISNIRNRGKTKQVPTWPS